MSDDPKTPLGRSPLVPAKRASTYIGDRGEVIKRSATPPQGLPRQDDQPTELAVPMDFKAKGDITGVHADPIVELVVRAERNQRLTEGVGVNTLSIATRLSVVEGDVSDVKGDVGELKTSVALVQATLEAQDAYMKPLVGVLVSGKTLEHTREKSTLERDTVREIDQLKAKDAVRERWTLTYKNVSTIAAPLLAALATTLAAIHWGHC